MLGYNKGKPDLHFWNYHIERGIKYRQACTKESEWPRWRQYYRNDYIRGSMPKNIFFEIIQLLIPRLYFRNPAIAVTPQDGTMEGLIMAKIIEKTTNKLFRMMRVKNTMQSILMSGFFTGTAIGKVGFGGIHVPTPSDYTNFLPVDSRGNPVDFSEGCMSNFPWFQKIGADSYVVPEGTNDLGTNKWFECYIYHRAIDDLKRDPTFTNARKVKCTTDNENTGMLDFPTKLDVKHAIDEAKIYEVRDRRNKTVFVYAPDNDSSGGGVLLYFGPDALQDEMGSPFLPFTYNKDDTRWWGIPYAKLIEPLQIEMNSIKDQKLRHMYLSIVKFIYKKGMFDQKQLNKFVSDKTGIGIEITGPGSPKSAIDFITTQTPYDFYRMETELYADLRQLVGLSRNASGEPMVDKSHANVTAEEIRGLQQSNNLRLDSNKDQLSDMLVELARLTHGIIFKHWDQEMVANIAGESRVPLWVNFRAKMLANTRFKLTVDPDSALPRTREVRIQEAIKIYQIVMQDPTNTASKEAVLKKLLQEYLGVDYEEYINTAVPNQSVPMAAQGVPQTAQALQGANPQAIQRQLAIAG